MRDLMEDFSIVFTIISITIILYFVFFGVWGHLEEKKAAKEKEMEEKFRPSLKRDDVVIYKDISGKRKIGLVATNVHHAKIVMVRPENKPNSIETVDYSNIKEIVK